jgi:hypothetical protein
MVPSDLIFYAMWVRSGRVVSKVNNASHCSAGGSIGFCV